MEILTDTPHRKEFLSMHNLFNKPTVPLADIGVFSPLFLPLAVRIPSNFHF